MTDRVMKKNPISIPHTVRYAGDIRCGECETAGVLGFALYELMFRVDEATFQVCCSAYSDACHWLVLCDHGNNDDDGYVIARLAKAVSIEVTLLAQESDKSSPEETALVCEMWLSTDDEIHASNIVWPEPADLIADTLLDTSSRQTPCESISQLIDRANSHPTPIVAVNIPSGPLTETGTMPGAVVNADHIITFIMLGPGLLTGKARDVIRQLHFDSLGPDSWLAGQETKIQWFSAERLSHWLKSRRPTSHKGDHGRLIIIDDDHGTAGAIRMTGGAAPRTGAGLVRILTRSENTVPLLTTRPGLVVYELTMGSPTESLEWADVVMVGPGLGQQEWGKKALQEVENFRKSMLWDADALNLLATNPNKRHNRVITSHLGEVTRLLGCSVAEIENDRLHYAERLVQHYSGVAVLKDAGTVTAAHPDALGIIGVGDAGMASSGMGDALSSIISVLLGQELSPYNTARVGCVTHGATVDVLAACFETRGIPATDLFSTLQRTVNLGVTDKNHDEPSNSTS